MTDDSSDPTNDPLKLRKRALARWDNEGGAEPNGPQTASAPVEGEAPMPENGPAEVASLHVRIIALENLLISLLATASDRLCPAQASRTVAEGETSAKYSVTLPAVRSMSCGARAATTTRRPTLLGLTSTSSSFGVSSAIDALVGIPAILA